MSEMPPPNDQPTSPTEPIAEPASPTPRRLTRSVDDRMLGGVAGGLGRYFNIDPVLARVAFAVLTLVGGAGVLAYLILWFVVPSDEDPGRTGGPQSKPSRVVIGTAALVAAALAVVTPFWSNFWIGPGILALAVFAAIGVVLWRSDRGTAGEAGDRLRRLLLITVVTALALVGGVAAAVASAAGGGKIVAALVIALGVVLVGAAFTGGARWLILPAFIVAVPVAFVTAAGVDASGGVGEREYRVASARELKPAYELGVGELRIDLRDVKFPAGRTDVKVKLGMGHVQVLVPREVCVNSNVHFGAGYARVFDRENGGLDMDWQESPTARTRAPRLHIDADIGIGALEVDDDPFDLYRFHDRFGSRSITVDAAGGNLACTEKVA